jgi:hypothetical protein
MQSSIQPRETRDARITLPQQLPRSINTFKSNGLWARHPVRVTTTDLKYTGTRDSSRSCFLFFIHPLPLEENLGDVNASTLAPLPFHPFRRSWLWWRLQVLPLFPPPLSRLLVLLLLLLLHLPQPPCLLLGAPPSALSFSRVAVSNPLPPPDPAVAAVAAAVIAAPTLLLHLLLTSGCCCCCCWSVFLSSLPRRGLGF